MGELADRREEIHVAPVDGRDKLDRYPLIVVELRFGLVKGVAHHDPVKHGCGIAIVMSKPQVGQPRQSQPQAVLHRAVSYPLNR